MAEIKNNFTSSKMNQDIDDRLMPNNEYRYALNLEVNRSEASDVGTLQNILGNSLAVDFNAVAETTGLECIGACVDEGNNNIYVFLTDNTGTAYSTTAQNYIYVYNNQQLLAPSLNPILLVSGPFLNFSTQYPIYGVNLIENLLFWTDNRNQPRKINVNKAANSSGYYWREEQISVAKPNPLYSPELFKVSDYNLSLAASATVGTVTGSGPYTATITPATAFLSSLLSVGDIVYSTAGTSSFTKGEVTSITTSGPNVTSFVVSSATTFTSGSISLLYINQYETTMYDRSSPTLPNGTTNPYYINDWPGDPAYLESRYVRFSYRYKFEDSEYSIMAPFTQIAYIPKQDGFFMYNASSPEVNDEEAAYRSTIVGFMQNKVNDILLQIILPCPANELYSTYKIVEIEILYKEADGIAVAAVDAIPTVPITLSPGQSYFWNTTETVYSYDYPSKKPFKTLPSRDVIRVNDIVPVKALSQEIVGNRVVYGNYQDKYTYPKYLDYNAGVSDRFPFGFGAYEGTSVIEYPNHSVKQNRNYQIGVILGDKFGRESGVILSDKLESGNATFGASSLYSPYAGVGEVIPYDWFGDSLKILFNQQIQPAAPDPLTGWPGLYNGDASSVDYNPLGWYSYKIVVKQTEQDYYNVYLPGVMAAYPDDPFLELGKTSHAVLLNDNINKVPRDLSEVGPAQRQFRSSVILFPRVNNNTLAYHNEQFYPGNEYAFVSTIATNNSLFFPDGISPTTPPAGFDNFYQINSDPLIARISTPFELGVVTTTDDIINLAVYETKPVESKLDIYWETSTSGLISELNVAIQEGSDSSVDSISGWDFELSEADGPGTTVTTPIVFRDILGAEITPTSVVLQSVFTRTGVDVSSKFFLEQVGVTNKYIIKTATTPPPGAYFYYGYNATNAERYSFTIRATVGSPPISNSFVLTGQLSNVPPTITNKPSVPIDKDQGDINIYDFNAVNGSNPSGGRSTDDLSWSIVAGDPMFSITSTGMLQDPSGLAEGTFNLTVRVTEVPTDEFDDSNITVTFPYRNSVVFSSWSSQSGSGSSSLSTAGTITISGIDANFNAFAEVNTGAMSVTTSVIINGTSLSAFRNTLGKDESSILTLSAGVYPYSVEVDRVASGFAIGGGGIEYIQ